MRFPLDIQKIKTEKRLKKREEMHELTSPLRIKRKMKPPVPTRREDLPESRESQPVERKGEVSSEISTEEPKDLPESRESRPEERKGEASLSSSAVGMVQTESTISEITSSMIVQNQGLAIITTNNTYASVIDILQRGLWIKHGEATIWSRLDEFG